MDLSKVSVNSSAGFVANTLKPICGVQLNNITKSVSSQAYVGVDSVSAGQPVTLKNKSEVGGNVLNISAVSTAVANLNGFALQSANELVDLGSEVGVAVKGQIIRVGTFGSGIEVYLPCDATLQDVTLDSGVTYDFTNKVLKKAGTSDTAISVTILGGVVDGQVVDVTGGVAKLKDTKAICVRL